MQIKQGKSVISIVDDDDLLRYCLNLILQRRGFSIKEAKNGKEALEEVQKRTPDLIILDGIMPVMDGIETAHVLKEDSVTKDIPIIFCTGQCLTELSQIDIPADAFLSKPFEFPKLYRMILPILEDKK
ncbi:MAG: response regulator [Candidatus Omnitrophica bacterium]|nr:response regulator [Candidatus Omnitrophota bacterium]